MQRNLPPEQIARTLERMVGVEYDLQHADEVPPSEGDTAHSLYVIRKLQRSGPTPQELSVQPLSIQPRTNFLQPAARTSKWAQS